MNKIGLFVDISNLFSATRKVFNGGLNYQEYKNWIEEAEQPAKVARSIAYGFHDPRGNLHKLISSLQYQGYETKFVQTVGDPRYTRWDVPMIVDIIRYMDHFDTIVIGSNDSNLIPVIQAVKDAGKRCVIFACLVSKQLKQAASECYEVDEDDLIMQTTSVISA